MVQDGFEVNHTCVILGVCRSAYYAWQSGVTSENKTKHLSLKPLVFDIFKQHRRRYGARRIASEMKELGEPCSRGKVRKIMVEMDLNAIQPRSFKPRTTNSRHTLGFSPNLLLAGVAVTRVNQVWVGDITYIPLTSQFAYMAVLMDRYSRKIVGWAIELSMDEGLVIAAFKQAIKARQPSPQLIHHTDRGGQYASIEYRKLLARAQMQQSMSRAADCYDNAYMESCFGTLKTELEIKSYDDLSQARQEISDYINYYNTLRRHSSLDNQSPNRFELRLNN